MNGSNYMSYEDAMNLDEEGIKRTVWGSKCTLIMELFTLTILWGVKGCLCIMFYRLTMKQGKIHFAVKIISVYCVLAYVLVTVLYLGYWCQFITGYWDVPVVHGQCASYYHHLIFATALNISADLMLLAIPLFIIPRLMIPLKRKLLLIGVLCLGIFNVLAAILNRYYNFSNPNSVVYLRWYAGEVGTAIYIVNLPACRPLVRRISSAAGLQSTGTLTSDRRPTTDSHAANPHSRRLQAMLSTNDRKPSLSESEVHLAEVRHDPWTAQFRQELQTHVSTSPDSDRDHVVPNGAIVMTTQVTTSSVRTFHS